MMVKTTVLRVRIPLTPPPVPRTATQIPFIYSQKRKMVLPQSKFQHSCVCERFIYSHNRSAYSAAGNMWTESLTDPMENVEIGPEAAQWNFRCSVDGNNP
jgi:hypothetical protein